MVHGVVEGLAKWRAAVEGALSEVVLVALSRARASNEFTVPRSLLIYVVSDMLHEQIKPLVLPQPDEPVLRKS